MESAMENFPIENPPWRWIRSVNLHITLKFLGEVDEALLEPLKRSAQTAASTMEPFSLGFGPFGGFPNLSRPRVLFYSVTEGAAELAELAGAVEKEVASLGFPPERRAFRAHVTLTRVKRPLDRKTIEKVREVEDLPGGTVQRVEWFSLFRSHLRREGAVYEELARFELGSLGER